MFREQRHKTPWPKRAAAQNFPNIVLISDLKLKKQTIDLFYCFKKHYNIFVRFLFNLSNEKAQSECFS